MEKEEDKARSSIVEVAVLRDATKSLGPRVGPKIGGPTREHTERSQGQEQEEVGDRALRGFRNTRFEEDDFEIDVQYMICQPCGDPNWFCDPCQGCVLCPGAVWGVDGDEEEIKFKTINVRSLPTPEEVERHRITHHPFRSWCEFCVRAKANNPPRSRDTAKDLQEYPIVSIDYCYMKTQDQSSASSSRDTQSEENWLGISMRDRASQS